MPQLTDLEQRLIGLLRENSRLPVSTLAQKLGVTRTTVAKTMTKLETNGLLLGYTVRLSDDAHTGTIRAISCLEVQGYGTKTVMGVLRAIPEIYAVHTTNGSWDLIVELRCRDLPEFDRALRRIREIKGIAKSQTSLLLTSVYM